MEIKKTSNLIRRQMDQFIGNMNIEYLTGANAWIIGYLAHHKDQDIFQKDLEEKFSIRRSTVSAMLSLMAEKGMIVREPVDHDARLKKLVLTDKALKIHERIETEIDQMEEKIAIGLTKEEVETFFSVIDKIKYNLEGEVK